MAVKKQETTDATITRLRREALELRMLTQQQQIEIEQLQRRLDFSQQQNKKVQ